jgi:hypothetical protein
MITIKKLLRNKIKKMYKFLSQIYNKRKIIMVCIILKL